MAFRQPQRILAGKRVSIPEELLKKWNMQEGDFVLVEETDAGITIAPAEISKKKIPA